MPENFESSNTESARLPIWLKLSCLVVAIALLFFLVNYYVNKKSENGKIGDTKENHFSYPIVVSSEWPDIKIRIDSVVRIDEETIVAEWAYYNANSNLSDAFSWGFSKPNYVALSKLIDGDGREFTVATTDSGDPICANTNRHDNSGWSKQIFGGRDLPVWAKFYVPRNSTKPLRLYLQGLDNKRQSVVNVPVLTIDDQYQRAYLPRATNWPDIFIQLTEINRSDTDTVHVTWKYLNKNENTRFFWGLDQPNFVGYTQIYDYSTGKFFDVARHKQNGINKLLCSSTNKDDSSGWSHSIEPGGSLDAHAVFKGVKGKNIQILFHSAMPLFYNPDKVLSQKYPKTN